MVTVPLSEPEAWSPTTFLTKKVIKKLQDISWWHWDYETILKNKFFFDTPIDDKHINNFEKKLDLKGDEEITMLDFRKKNVKDYLLNGWWEKEFDLCWTSDKEAGLILKTLETKKFKYLSFFGSSYYLPQKMSVIINRRKTGHVLMKTEPAEYKIKIGSLKKGVNTVELIFERGVSPASIGQSGDKRILYCCFKRFLLS